MENINTTPETPVQSFTIPTPSTPQKNIYKSLFFIFFALFLIVTSVSITLLITKNKNQPSSQTSQITPTSVPIKTSVSYKTKTVQDDINSVSKLVLIDENQKEITISEAKYLNMPVGIPVSKSEFRDIVFSPDYNFLSYMLVGYEGGVSRLYDIKNRKEMSLNFPAKTLGFTSDSKYFYACAESGMMSGGAVVTELSKMKNIFSVLDEKSFTCKYNQDNKEISFTQTEGPGSNNSIAEYLFSEKSGSILKTK